MAGIQVKPGRARVNLKVWTHTMSTDLTGAHMSERAATLIYKITLSGKSDREAVLVMLDELDAAAAAKAAASSPTAQQVIDSHRTGDQALGADAKASGRAS